MISKTGAALILGQIVLFRSGDRILGGKLQGVLDDQASIMVHDGEIFQHVEGADIVHAAEAFESIKSRHELMAELKPERSMSFAELKAISDDGGSGAETAPETPLNDPAAVGEVLQGSAETLAWAKAANGESAPPIIEPTPDGN